MDKNPLIGVSIIAVVLLVLGSLSNVVGYQSAQSSGVNESLLFSIRTQKANNHLKNVISSQYLGKGKDALLQFPIRDNRTELLKKAIEFISKMDDKTFAWFTELCIQRTRQDNTLSDSNPNEITQMLQLLRTQPDTITYSLSNRNNQANIVTGYLTICFWFPGCFLFIIYVIIVVLISMLFGFTLNVPCTEWTIYH